jgi:hypothetical protein
LLAALGSDRHERTAGRRGYRHGARTRMITTTAGTRPLVVPRGHRASVPRGRVSVPRRRIVVRAARVRPGGRPPERDIHQHHGYPARCRPAPRIGVVNAR